MGEFYIVRLKDELYHYGIKGMKWGVRRTKEQLMYDRYSIEAKSNNNLHKIKTPNNIKINRISTHALNRIEDRDDRKVSAKDIFDALEKPLYISDVKTNSNGKKSIRYIGEKATVNVNPDTGVIPTVWKTGISIRNKYKGNKS